MPGARSARKATNAFTPTSKPTKHTKAPPPSTASTIPASLLLKPNTIQQISSTETPTSAQRSRVQPERFPVPTIPNYNSTIPPITGGEAFVDEPSPLEGQETPKLSELLSV